MNRDLSYYKGRLIDFEELIMQEQDIAWMKVYLTGFLKCCIAIRTIEMKLGFVTTPLGRAYPTTGRKMI